MPPLSTKAWIQIAVSGVTLCVGGPALVMWVSPTEEELFKRYNPELQKRSLENRQQRQEDFDKFVTNLKKLSKSDKNIWEVQKELDRLAAEDPSKPKSMTAEMDELRSKFPKNDI